MRKSKAQIIRSLLAQGKTAKEIAALTGVTPQYVYCIRHAEKKKATPKKIRAKAKAKAKPVHAPVLFDATQNPPIPAPLTLKQRFMVLFTGRV